MVMGMQEVSSPVLQSVFASPEATNRCVTSASDSRGKIRLIAWPQRLASEIPISAESCSSSSQPRFLPQAQGYLTLFSTLFLKLRPAKWAETPRLHPPNINTCNCIPCA